MTGGTGAISISRRIMYGFNECQVAGAIKGWMAGSTARCFRNGMDLVKYMGIMTVGAFQSVGDTVVDIFQCCGITAAVAGGAGARSVARCIMYCFNTGPGSI